MATDRARAKLRHRAASVLARAGTLAFHIVAAGGRASLAAYPRPASPIADPWELSIASLVANHPKVPSIAARPLRRLDKFGRVTIAPDRVGFDDRTVRWSRVIEIRAYTTADPVPAVVVDREIDRIREIFPPIPGRRWLLRKAVNFLLAVIRVVFGPSRWQARTVPELPCEIVYRNVLGRMTRLPAGLLAAVILAAIPEVSDSLITTARTRAIPVRTVTDATGAKRVVRAEQVRHKPARVGASN